MLAAGGGGIPQNNAGLARWSWTPSCCCFCWPVGGRAVRPICLCVQARAPSGARTIISLHAAPGRGDEQQHTIHTLICIAPNARCVCICVAHMREGQETKQMAADPSARMRHVCDASMQRLMHAAHTLHVEGAGACWQHSMQALRQLPSDQYRWFGADTHSRMGAWHSACMHTYFAVPPPTRRSRTHAAVASPPPFVPQPQRADCPPPPPLNDGFLWQLGVFGAPRRTGTYAPQLQLWSEVGAWVVGGVSLLSMSHSLVRSGLCGTSVPSPSHRWVMMSGVAC